MPDATTVKCPTCARTKGSPCITLGKSPDGRFVWAAIAPHPARTARAGERG